MLPLEPDEMKTHGMYKFHGTYAHNKTTGLVVMVSDCTTLFQAGQKSGFVAVDIINANQLVLVLQVKKHKEQHRLMVLTSKGQLGWLLSNVGVPLKFTSLC